MKKCLVLIIFCFCSSVIQSQNSTYEERKLEMEARKEAKRKHKEEYLGQDGILYKKGDTIIVNGKMGLYDGVYLGVGAMETQLLWKRQKDVKDIRLIIREMRKTTYLGETIARAICKGIDKKGRFTVYVDKASYNCEIRDCED